MRWIGGFIRGLWQFSRTSWVSVDANLRPRSGASALYLFLFLVFAVVGAILLPLGIDLDTADHWIDAQGGWLDAAGSLIFRMVCAIILVIAAFMVVAGSWQRLIAPRHGEDDVPSDKLGWGAIAAAAFVGYFAWFGVFG
jgi:hypothetical protein